MTQCSPIGTYCQLCCIVGLGTVENGCSPWAQSGSSVEFWVGAGSQKDVTREEILPRLNLDK